MKRQQQGFLGVIKDAWTQIRSAAQQEYPIQCAQFIAGLLALLAGGMIADMSMGIGVLAFVAGIMGTFVLPAMLLRRPESGQQGHVRGIYARLAVLELGLLLALFVITLVRLAIRPVLPTVVLGWILSGTLTAIVLYSHWLAFLARISHD